MDYVPRTITDILLQRVGQFPVVALTGVRQAGKTTLVRHVLGDWRYVNLEDMDTRMFAVQDPRGFLAQYGPGTIIDEFQRAPELTSYIQGKVDENNTNGQYVLTGSQSYLLHQGVSQSLAGRVALLALFPFAWTEMPGRFRPDALEQALLLGAFPRTVPGGVPAGVWFGSFLSSYVERDVRALTGVKDLLKFQAFIKLVASRTGQLVNYTSLATDVGVSVPTVRNWLSILEAGYIVLRVPPWHSNLRKRVVKTPKLYFVDTGLLCRLLDITSAEALRTHALRGPVFENWVVVETLKHINNRNLAGRLYFYRDFSGNEVDLVVETGAGVLGVEVKSGSTVRPAFFKGLKAWQQVFGQGARGAVVYAGAQDQAMRNTPVIPWQAFPGWLDKGLL